VVACPLLLVEGRPFDARRAQSSGLVNQILPREQLESALLNRARALAQIAPEAMHLSKQLLREPQRTQLHATIDQEARLFAERLTSPEARAAFTAFLHAG